MFIKTKMHFNQLGDSKKAKKKKGFMESLKLAKKMILGYSISYGSFILKGKLWAKCISVSYS